MEVQFRSYAKINLGLLLHEKRKDGYHEIETIFQLIDLHDTITFQKLKSNYISISCSDSNVPLDKNNLVHRAFSIFKQTFPFEGGFKVDIEKRIPSGGGLGGGSSNAAVTLYACKYFWHDSVTSEQLDGMALKIGSDVPFFMMGGTALGLGRGEQLTSLIAPQNYWVVLLSPGFSVSTGWAYQQAKIGLTNEEKIGKLMALFKETEVHTWRKSIVNELEGVVFERHPELRKIKSQLYEMDAFYASMSGSGSTMYGLFFDRKTAEAAITFFSKLSIKALLARPVNDLPLNQWKE